MTNEEEAIKILKNDISPLISSIVDGSEESIAKATRYDKVIKLAIKALELDLPIKVKCCFCPHCDNCDVNDDGTLKIIEDCVSRQAVKSQMLKFGFLAPDMTVTEFVEDCLPSVTPTNEDIKEAYLKGYDYGVKDWFKSKTQPCEDCISRQAVIRLVEQYPNIIGNRCSGLIADIKHLPSVTPKSEDNQNEIGMKSE